MNKACRRRFHTIILIISVLSLQLMMSTTLQAQLFGGATGSRPTLSIPQPIAKPGAIGVRNKQAAKQVEPAGVCTITSSHELVFNNYISGQTTVKDDAAGIEARCSNDSTRVTAFVSPSAEGNGYTTRAMTRVGHNDKLDYQLFTSYSRNVVWGDGVTGDTGPIHSLTNQAGGETLDVFGRILANQNVPAGRYEEKVTVTIEP